MCLEPVSVNVLTCIREGVSFLPLAGRVMDFTICGLHPYVVAAFVGLLVGYNFALSRAFEKTRDQLEKLEAEELRSGGAV